MGLLRDTMVVGAATFIVGSVLREVSIKERSGEPLGWWPYVGTFVAGALGYYLVRATNVVKASEWDWDGLDWKYVSGDKLVYCDGCEDYCIPTWSHSAYKCQKCSQLYSRECMDRRRKDGLWCKNCKSAQFLTIWPEETFHAEGPTDGISNGVSGTNQILITSGGLEIVR